jgi:integrase
MVIVQAGLGLRLGELLALREQDVGLVSRSVRIEWQFAPQSKVRAEPKTPRSRRTVPLPQVVADAIEAHVKEYPPAADGTLTHDLRHHYASVLLAQGGTVIVVAERLGHENANLVLSTYGHLMPDSEERTRRAIDDAWSGAPAVSHRRNQPREQPKCRRFRR